MVGDGINGCSGDDVSTGSVAGVDESNAEPSSAMEVREHQDSSTVGRQPEPSGADTNGSRDGSGVDSSAGGPDADSSAAGEKKSGHRARCRILPLGLKSTKSTQWPEEGYRTVKSF